MSQLVLPKDLREMVLTSLHDNMGHLGLESSTTKSSPSEHTDQQALGTGLYGLLDSRARQQQYKGYIGHYRPFYEICYCSTYQRSEGSDCGQMSLGSFLITLWLSRKSCIVIRAHISNPEPFKSCAKVVGIRKVRRTLYYPRRNPLEQFNRTLLKMLRTLENDKKAHWKELL